MRIKYLALALLTGFAWAEAPAQRKQPQPSPQQAKLRNVEVTSPDDTYMITMHTSVPAKGYGSFREELYTVVHGVENLKVKYSESQTSSAKPGDFPGSGLHLHSSYSNPDLSQVPSAGVPIRACLFDKNRDKDGDLVIAVQPTPEPCMARIGNVLRYEPSPNGPALFTYVTFEISSETTTTVSAATRVQSPPLRKDIPTIVKAASGAVVTIFVKSGDSRVEGTGFLVSPEGAIVTNYHVIKTGDMAVVKFPDSTVLPVDGVLAADKDRDLAIIKIHGKTFQTLTLGNSDRVQVGEEVVAIGDSLGLELTVSNGILSGVRTVEKEGHKLLQTTAPISHGNSGGPLFNMTGEVIGINTMFLGDGQNLNFAIPVNDAKRLLSTRSTMLQNLPNEAEPKEAPPEESPAPPSAGQGLNSPAYRQYQELLKANDLTVRAGLYACFYDNTDRSKTFFVVSANLRNKHAMGAIVSTFADGVLEDSPLIFEGKIEPFSSKRGIFADLPTLYDHKNDLDKSHETDVLKWVSGDITIEAGWGKLAPGQVRMGYRFKLQHSTGRFIEDTELNFPGADSSSNSTIHEPGRCARIPNTAMPPEEQYELVDN
jgi:V8-like Glu-specific endopeptidase